MLIVYDSADMSWITRIGFPTVIIPSMIAGVASTFFSARGIK